MLSNAVCVSSSVEKAEFPTLMDNVCTGYPPSDKQVHVVGVPDIISVGPVRTGVRGVSVKHKIKITNEHTSFEISRK